jgi:hypothetical protein
METPPAPLQAWHTRQMGLWDAPCHSVLFDIYMEGVVDAKACVAARPKTCVTNTVGLLLCPLPLLSGSHVSRAELYRVPTQTSPSRMSTTRSRRAVGKPGDNLTATSKTQCVCYRGPPTRATGPRSRPRAFGQAMRVVLSSQGPTSLAPLHLPLVHPGSCVSPDTSTLRLTACHPPHLSHPSPS